MVPVPSLSPCHCHPRAIPVPVPSVPHAAVVPVPPHGTAIPMPLCSLCHWCCPRAITIPVPPLSLCHPCPHASVVPVPSPSPCHHCPFATAAPIPLLSPCHHHPCDAVLPVPLLSIPVPPPSPCHRPPGPTAVFPPRAPTPRALTPFPAPHFHRSPPPLRPPGPAQRSLMGTPRPSHGHVRSKGPLLTGGRFWGNIAGTGRTRAPPPLLSSPRIGTRGCAPAPAQPLQGGMGGNNAT